jgi:aminoglycoside phosphotransferase (APT) family kinase protein
LAGSFLSSVQGTSDDIRPRPQHGWLVALLPADVGRFRASDPEVVATLTAAGAERVETTPDVEIATAGELRGDASAAIVLASAERPAPHVPRALRGAMRLAASAAVRTRVARARRAARARGYRFTRAVTWEGHVKLRRDLTGTTNDGRLFHRFPLSVAVMCGRDGLTRTLFDAALEEAEQATDHTLAVDGLLLGTSGVIVSTADELVLRVSLGAPGRRVEEARSALRGLAELQPPPVVTDRVPWVVAAGQAGIGVWSVERRLQGRVPASPLDERLKAECMDFLQALHASGGADVRSPLFDDADTVADAFPEAAERIGALVARLDGELAEVPRGFAHGDFWAGNLLTDSGALVGVVDWPSAGPGRLPLLDLLHLRANERRELDGSSTARVVLEELLPGARAGGDELDREYCARVGVDAVPRVLEALVGAYWLSELAHDVADADRDPSKPLQPEWREANLAVLASLAHNTTQAAVRR